MNDQREDVGGDGISGATNTLYQCANGSLSTVQVCANGCHVNPT